MTQGRRVALTSVIILIALSVSFAAWSASTSPSNNRSTIGETSTTETSTTVATQIIGPPPRAGGPISDVVLGSIGLGVVDFGASVAATQEALTDSLGSPSAEPLSGCVGPWTQIEWNDLIVEFLNGNFVGYRYLLGAYESTPQTSASPTHTTVNPHGTPVPRLLTAAGISLGSTLQQIKATYPGITQTGSFTWTSPEGIHFVVYSNSYPSPPSSPITEIKIGTCGDW